MFELFRLGGTIKINNDAANTAIDETTDKAENAESKMSGNFSKIGTKALKMASVVGTAAATTAATITTMAVKGYADYEQLVGGVDTLFKESSQKVQEYANNAYQTAGLSANAYMETVTSFSASLLQALGGNTEEAADMANMAIVDMSDNANKMGTDMTMIQNAYQGFAKQNYTMLDNLKLGYGGTQEEMVRLINDSGVLNEKISSMDGIKFDTVVEAIHEIQTEIGITGTTQAEASATIQGSISAMKGAWENLLVGIAAGDQDVSMLFQNLYDSGVTVAENLIPRIKTAFTGLFDLVTEKLPWIDELAAVIATVTGAVAAYVAVQKLKTALDIKEAATIGAVTTALWAKVTAMAAALAPYLAIAAVIAVVITAGVKLYKNWDKVKAKAVELKNKLSQTFTNIKSTISNTMESIKNSIVDKITAAKDKVKGIIDIIKGLFSFKVKMPKIPLPHFDVKPDGWKLGDLLEGITPSLGIEWYAKAMDNPMVMTSPTIFGYNSASGSLMAGGEAGSEVVSGTNTLMGMISEAVARQTGGQYEVLQRILSVLMSMDDDFAAKISTALDQKKILWNDRELGRLVNKYAG